MLNVGELKTFINANLKARLGLKEISTVFKKHPADLDRAFRNVEGITIKKYIDLRLKQEVENLLRQDDVKGYRIGKQLGFYNDQSFYRWTKRVFGVTFSSLHQQIVNGHTAADSKILVPSRPDRSNRNPSTKNPQQKITPKKSSKNK